MKHLPLILTLMLAGSAHCQTQDTVLADPVSIYSDDQLFERGFQHGRHHWYKKQSGTVAFLSFPVGAGLGFGLGQLNLGLLPVIPVVAIPIVVTAMAVIPPTPSEEDFQYNKSFSNPMFLAGWTKGAHRRKAWRVIGNFSIGTASFIVVTGVIVLVGCILTQCASF